MDPIEKNQVTTRPTTQVPQELVDQFHQANEEFHEAKQALERVMDGSDYRHEERMEAAMEGMRKAERTVEEVEKRVSEKLKDGK